jgi:hypothetical protein
MFACVYLGAAASPAAKATAHLEVSASRALPMSLRYPGRVPRASLRRRSAPSGWKPKSHRRGWLHGHYSSHQQFCMPLGRVVAVEAEPPELAAPVVERGVVADVLAVLPLEPLPDVDAPGACCLTVLVETSQH